MPYAACSACGQPVPSPRGAAKTGGPPPCRNLWCAATDRPLQAVFSVGRYEAALRRAIIAYKYRADLRWARPFGGLLHGFLSSHATWFEEYDAICPVPSFLGSGARRRWGHVELFCAEAASLSGVEWPVLELVVKTRETAPMSGQPRHLRRQIGAAMLASALVVPCPDEVAGRRVVIADDVCASGETLTAVARALRQAGAAEAVALVLARAAWHPAGGRGAAERSPSAVIS